MGWSGEGAPPGGGGSVAVADVPHAPAATVGVSVAGLDCLHPLGAGVPCPTLSSLAGEGAAVAGVPDFVRLVDGHGSFRFDGISLQGQGIWQAPGRTLL